MFSNANSGRIRHPMREWLRLWAVTLPTGILSLLCLALLGLTPTAQPAAAAPSPANSLDCAWTLVNSPNTHQYNSLNAVAVISANDAWAVGSRGDSFTGELTLIEHWNGSTWSIVPSPNPGGESNELLGVTALSANDIWAVGYHSQASQTLVLHWDGIAWTHILSPNVGTLYNGLRSIDALAPNDIWAVGYSWSADGNRRRTMTMHWDGTEWSIVPSPSVGPHDNYLLSVSALSPGSVWAVGSYISTPGESRTLTLHWDGSQWNTVASPSVPALNNYLNGVSAVSSTDVWAVGYSCDGNCFSTEHSPTTMHWDGTEWSLVATPDIAPYVWLNAVHALSGSDVWAVGLYSTGTEAGALTLHWDGGQWSQVTAPNPDSTSPELKAIDALASNEIWSVGAFHFTGNPVFRTLTEHYTGTCPPASVTPASPTSTPVPPTRTATQAVSPTSTLPIASATATHTVPPLTSTPSQTTTTTPTPCLIAFSDVPPDSTFHAQIRCLACRGIISGYSDGTFKPGNDVTRGQLSKIVANAAGFNDPVIGQTFSDVSPGHTFYEFIERIALRGIIGGYSDGTFRPGNPATRGQISKIVANAAGFGEPVSGQTFSDVPPTHTFYEFIERIAVRSIIGGYADGTFRPGNNATRGQTSKIVANTFFPECP